MTVRKIIFALLVVISMKVKASTNNMGDSIPFYFDEIKAATAKAYILWNKNLYGPLLLVDPKTRLVYANEQDSAFTLISQKNYFTGILPSAIPLANTAVNWGGKRWAMVLLPLPENSKDRIDLLSHELFHQSQPSMGFALNNPDNHHLDKKEGRVYLRLEMNALNKALKSKNIKNALPFITDALAFRYMRYKFYPEAAVSENLLELNEGMAAYTGLIIAGRSHSEVIQFLTKSSSDFIKQPSFVRSFAYLTIPLYGYLLSQIESRWNLKIDSSTSLTDFYRKSFKVDPNPILNYADLKKYEIYEAEDVIKDEEGRENKRKQLLAYYKKELITSPHTIIKFQNMQVSFDPRELIPLENEGTVYPGITITDSWGILTVTNGALMSPQWDQIRVSYPVEIKNNIAKGVGWKLELNEGYNLIKPEGQPHYQLIKR